METKILEEIGLTKTEIKLYLALLELGQSTTTSVIKKSEVPASKVYEFLNRLIKKGLVSYVIKSNKKYFSASPPESLMSFLKEKKEKISEQEKQISILIPQLNQTKNKEDRIGAEVYEGLKGIKSIYEKILASLKKGETQYVLGAPKQANEKIEGYLLEWHKRRIKKGINCKYIYNSDSKEYGEVRENMKNTEVRYLPNNIISPTWTEIFNEYIFIGHIKGPNAVLFLIKDKEIAKNYLNYFNLIWKQCTK